ncbi:unnamed protein product [Lactuca saligna]|uniref:Secreted protein n=1 Tax=Lactuca saligna TaxID=75948 RepID=A0AA35YUM4_LACSI|nr:unnamed protein product [Lactuca saligna]
MRHLGRHQTNVGMWLLLFEASLTSLHHQLVSLANFQLVDSSLATVWSSFSFSHDSDIDSFTDFLSVCCLRTITATTVLSNFFPATTTNTYPSPPLFCSPTIGHEVDGSDEPPHPFGGDFGAHQIDGS